LKKAIDVYFLKEST